MATPSSSSTAPRAAAVGGGGGGSNSNSNSNSNREGAAKVAVAEQISQAVQSTSNLLHLMQQSSPQAQLIQLPKNLLAKTPTIKNTGQVLEQLPRVISLLDAYVESGLESIPHLKTVLQLLANMESCQLNSLSQAQPVPEEHDRADQSSVEG